MNVQRIAESEDTRGRKRLGAMKEEVITMSAIMPYRHLFDIDPFMPLFPGEHELRGLTNDILPGGFPGGFRMDVEDNDDNYVVTSELAGVAKEDIDVKFEDDRLTISVDHKESDEKKERNFVHKETREWSATRSVVLHGVVSDGITAKLTDGILTITLPKEEQKEAPSNKVTIE